MPPTTSRSLYVARCCVAALCVTSIRAAAVAAQGPRPMTLPGLGTIAFPVATKSAAAESAFVKGVLLLHVFEYDRAAASFQQAQRLDPTMALAWWGEAMTHDHPVWNEEDVPAARAALAKYAPTAAAREAKAPSPLTRGFVHAVDLLFGDGPKARRDTLYSAVMDSLLIAYPDDDEVRAFYALSLLGLSQGVRNVPTYLRAAAIAESVFARNPRHPGAAHYWIHGMDDPDHAADALPAARALSRIAPDAGHAQHMTSHIFMALGMWRDVVRANLDARRVAQAPRAARGLPPTWCGHGTLWLEYGYLQLGALDSAAAIMRGCRAQAGASDAGSRDPDNSAMGSAVEMWSHYLIDAAAWRGEDAAWSPALSGRPWQRATWQYTNALAAAARADGPATCAGARAFAATREELVKLMAGAPDEPENIESRAGLEVEQLELEAECRLVDRKDADSAVALLGRATREEDGMAFAFGPPGIEKPSHELLGDVLLGLGRKAEAAAEYAAALKRAPGRSAAVKGLAAAKE